MEKGQKKLAGSEKNDSQVGKIVNELYAEVDIVNCEVSSLEDKLKPVMSDIEELDKKVAPEIKSPKLVPLAENLNAINLQIRNIRCRIKSITARIEV